MKKILNLLAGIFFLINTSFANDLNYKLNLTNINFTSEKTVEFDIYLMNANESKTEEKEHLRYALGQYFIDINPKFANSGTLTYSIVKSDLPESMRPSRVAVSGNQLRMSVNQINPDFESLPVIPNVKPGLLIGTMKLETSADKFSKDDFDLKWSDDENNFRTKIVAYENDKLTEVTDIRGHYIDLDYNANSPIDETTSIPTEYSLSQNYPNPFNPTTNLEFGIPELGFVSLKVYDISGKEVATLVNEIKSPGRYNVKFDGSNFASGVYFYKITSGNFSAVKRMFLIK
ncbi:MAG: T9SS type A sorting domain-containing protein [Ignavibacteriae bacterium]|nr:T9SS type A sorting domain-containing protein [Ignavibacteriota bacterium]